jgi:hypothetical protein
MTKRESVNGHARVFGKVVLVVVGLTTLID